MADEGTTSLFVNLIVFWTLLLIVTNITGITLTLTDTTEYLPNQQNPPEEVSSFKTFITGLFDDLEQLPILNVFMPLIKIMSFQYTDQVPAALSAFLSMTMIFTGYIIYNLIRG